MAPSPWDFLRDQKPIPLVDYLLSEAATHIARDLSLWPLPVHDLAPHMSHTHQAFLEKESTRPNFPVYEQCFLLAQWELNRDFQAIDDYMRNRRWALAGLNLLEKSQLLWVTEWLLESLWALSEATQGRVNRKLLSNVLHQIQQRWKTIVATASPLESSGS